MRRRAPGGFVLPMVVIALAVMGVLAIAILTTSGDEREASLAVQEGTRSFYAADAGLNHVVAQWPDSSYDNRVAAAGSSYTFAWRTLPENGATYRAVLQRLSAGGPISLTVDGRSASARRGLRTVQVALTVSSSFKYAVIGDADLKFSGGGTDSWDSALGVYGGANVATNGDIYSNGTISQLSGSTSINGDAQAGTTIVAGGCAKVHGTICAVGQPLVPLAAESCPSGFSPAVDIPGGAGITYNPATGVLSVSGGKTLTLDYSHTPYRFSNVTFSGSSILTFAGTVQHEDIYVSGTLNLSGGTIANPSGKAPNLSIWGCGADASNWTISGGSGAFFAVHAPNHQVTLSGGGAIYGGLVVRSLVNSGGSQIHYDEALGRTGVLVLMPGSWTEVAH